MSAPGWVSGAEGWGRARAQSRPRPPTQNSLCVLEGRTSRCLLALGMRLGQEAGGPVPGGKSWCLWSACLRVDGSKAPAPVRVGTAGWGVLSPWGAGGWRATQGLNWGPCRDQMARRQPPHQGVFPGGSQNGETRCPGSHPISGPACDPRR